MDKKALEQFAFDLQSAVIATLVKNKIPAQVQIAATSGSIVIRIPLPAAATGNLTINAVSRYNANRTMLGLPVIGTQLVVMGVMCKLVGLSSDGKRVKIIKFTADDKVVDVPIVDVLHAVSLQGAKQVADLDAQEAALPDDQIDASVLGLLAAIGQKAATKPAEGQQ